MDGEDKKNMGQEEQLYEVGTLPRLVMNDSYNINMNNVDVADQLRGGYRPDRRMRKQKWCCSMFFWGNGTLIVNAFIAYRRYMEMEGK